MNHRLPFARLFLSAMALGALLPAQGQDPMHEIQEIARKVDEQLQEIDQLLLESGKKSQARSKQQELLEKAAERATTVDGGIDQLIEKLTQMKNQGGGSGQGEDQQQQPQDGQSQPRPGQGQGQQNRRENQGQDFVQQPKDGEQQGQQGQPKPDGKQQGQQKPGEGDGQPTGGEQAKDQSDNRQGNRQLEPDLGPGQPGSGEGSWGELQPYLNHLKNRGSAPKVPEKYRKYWQAYLKNKQAGDGK